VERVEATAVKGTKRTRVKAYHSVPRLERGIKGGQEKRSSSVVPSQLEAEVGKKGESGGLSGGGGKSRRSC